MPLNELYRHPLFKAKAELLSTDDRVSLAYKRAGLVLRTHRLTAADVQFCTQKYWDLITDPICCRDTGMFTILAAHIGLAIGSLSRHLNNRPDLKPLVDRMLRFDTVGIYLLTERGHGLDAFNIETTATKTADGFILHTPREEAAKFMPASTPAFGIAKVALVMAKLIVDNEDRGGRLFIVPICNEREMYRGVSSIRLPPLTGYVPLDFSITRFDHVYLPPTALVSSDINDLSMPREPQQAWWNEIWRIQLGTMAVPAPWISAMKATAYIGGSYSMHRCITGKDSSPIPIISFRTQQWSIAHGVAVAMVMDNWYRCVIQRASDPTMDQRVRHALAVMAKTTICRHSQRCLPDIAERCGAQGILEHNSINQMETSGKGMIIAEGDILTLCIRLFSELLIGRYEVSMPPAEESLLAHHAASLMQENRRIAKRITGGNHRSNSFNSIILPQSESVIEAMGHADAYSEARKANLPQPILDVYECAVMRRDPAWYSEVAGISQFDQRIREDKAVTSFMPHLPKYLADLEIDKYVVAPIVSDASWKKYLSELPVFCGNAIFEEELLHARL